MKYVWKRTLCLMLCALFCAALFTGCADAPADVTPPEKSVSSAVDETVNTDPAAGSVQTAVATLDSAQVENLTLTKHSTDLLDHVYSCSGRPAFNGDRLWYYCYNLTEDEIPRPIPQIASMKPDGSDLQVQQVQLSGLKTEVTPEPGEGEYIDRSIAALIETDSERPLLLCQTKHYTLVESRYYPLQTRYYIGALDANGQFTESIPLDFVTAEGCYFTYKGAAGDSIWFEYKSVYAFEISDQTIGPAHLMGFSVTDGSLLADITLPERVTVESFSPLSGGRALICICEINPRENGYEWKKETSRFYILDPAADSIALKEPLSLPAEITGQGWFEMIVQTKNAPSDGGVLWTNKGLYLWDLDTNVLTQKYDWLDTVELGVPSTNDFYSLYFNDGRYLYRAESDSRKPLKLCYVAPAGTPTTEDDGRAVITIGTVDPAELLDAVESFNAASADYRVELVGYSDADAQAAGLADGIELMLRDIVQGAVPDIVALPNGADTAGLLNKGLFTDLYPFLDADPDMARDDFVQGVLTACETDNRLTTLVPCYNLLSAVGSAARLGSDPGWSWAEFEKATANCRVPYYGLNRQMALWYQVQMGGSRFIDYGTGKADFVNDNFVRLLESCAVYPEQMPDLTADLKPGFASGDHLLQFLFAVSFGDVPRLTYQFDGPIVYKGLPSDEGSGSVFAFGLRLGITTACAEPEAAWQFLRTLLLPEFQNALTDGFTTYLPLRRDSLERLAQKHQKSRTDGIAVPAYLGQPTQAQLEYFGRALTQEETDAILGLIEATDTLFQYVGTVMDILMEESLNYYNGQCTAEAAAQYIQNRVQLYLDERA